MKSYTVEVLEKVRYAAALNKMGACERGLDSMIAGRILWGLVDIWMIGGFHIGEELIDYVRRDAHEETP